MKPTRFRKALLLHLEENFSNTMYDATSFFKKKKIKPEVASIIINELQSNKYIRVGSDTIRLGYGDLNNPPSYDKTKVWIQLEPAGIKYIQDNYKNDTIRWAKIAAIAAVVGVIITILLAVFPPKTWKDNIPKEKNGGNDTNGENTIPLPK